MSVLVNHHFLENVVKVCEVLSDVLRKKLHAERKQSKNFVDKYQILDIHDLNNSGHDLLNELCVDILSEVFDQGNQQLYYLTFGGGIVYLFRAVNTILTTEQYVFFKLQMLHQFGHDLFFVKNNQSLTVAEWLYVIVQKFEI